MLKYDVDPICFDDILLVPQLSDVRSRHDVDLTMVIGSGSKQVVLDLPVIAAPMDTVCDIEMCIALASNGALGILHRYMPIKNIIERVKVLADSFLFGVSVGATNGYMNDVEDLVKAGAKIVLVDTANGHSQYAIDAVSNISKAFPHVHIMAGNVATADGYVRLSDAGASSVRVGIGGGSACTTRIVSGHGIPTLASIIDCKNRYEIDTSIIADGGIKTTGDMVKAFAAGADAVMVGSMFAGTDESPGHVIVDETGRKFKEFRGMASEKAQKARGGKISVSEGVSTTVNYKVSVVDIISDIVGGLGSGCSYTGVESLSSLYNESLYVEVSSASMLESSPHSKKGK
jgi:IMP dehydrogenase